MLEHFEKLQEVARELKRERDDAQESLIEARAALLMALHGNQRLLELQASRELYIAALEAQLEPSVIEEIKTELSALGHPKCKEDL